MGCCSSRIKDPKEKSRYNHEEDECAEGEQRTINGLIAGNMKKRHKSFIAITQEKLVMENRDFM